MPYVGQRERLMQTARGCYALGWRTVSTLNMSFRQKATGASAISAHNLPSAAPARHSVVHFYFLLEVLIRPALANGVSRVIFAL